MAARADPIAKVMEMVRFTLMPMSWAAALSSEQARIALPILVLPVNHAMAARADPIAKVMEMVRFTLMPMSWAAALSSEQARIALPILVLPVNHLSPAMMTRQATTVTIPTAETL